MYKMWQDLNQMVTQALSGQPPETKDQRIVSPEERAHLTNQYHQGHVSSPQRPTLPSREHSHDLKDLAPDGYHRTSASACGNGLESGKSQQMQRSNSDELDLDLNTPAPPLSFNTNTIMPTTLPYQGSNQSTGEWYPQSRNTALSTERQKSLKWWPSASDPSGPYSNVPPPAYESLDSTSSYVAPAPHPAPAPNETKKQKPPSLEHPYAQAEVAKRLKAQVNARQERAQDLGLPYNVTETRDETSPRFRLSNSDVSYFAELALCDAVTCPMCGRFFADPVTLPCGHSVCASCLYSGWDKITEDTNEGDSKSEIEVQSDGSNLPPVTGITLRFLKCVLCGTSVHGNESSKQGTMQHLRPSASLVVLSALAQRLARTRGSPNPSPTSMSPPDETVYVQSRDSEFLEDMKEGLRHVYGDAKATLGAFAKNARETFNTAYTRMFDAKRGQSDDNYKLLGNDSPSNLQISQNPNITPPASSELSLRIPREQSAQDSTESPVAFTPLSPVDRVAAPTSEAEEVNVEMQIVTSGEDGPQSANIIDVQIEEEMRTSGFDRDSPSACENIDLFSIFKDLVFRRRMHIFTMSEPVVYHGCTLYKDDILLLDQGKWLNDTIIHYAYEHLLHEIYPDISDSVVFVSPQTTFIMMHEQDEEDFRDLLRFQVVKERSSTESQQEQKSHKTPTDRVIFFPINNSTSFHQTSGSHWSLLVLILSSEMAFYHFDSSPSKPNSQIASEFSSKLADCLNRMQMPLDDGGSHQREMHSFVCMEDVPTQTNSFDCGVFVINSTNAICKWVRMQAANLESQKLKANWNWTRKEFRIHFSSVVTQSSTTQLRDSLKNKLQTILDDRA